MKGIKNDDILCIEVMYYENYNRHRSRTSLRGIKNIKSTYKERINQFIFKRIYQKNTINKSKKAFREF